MPEIKTKFLFALALELPVVGFSDPSRLRAYGNSAKSSRARVVVNGLLSWRSDEFRRA